jgi:hypothetical protein
VPVNAKRAVESVSTALFHVHGMTRKDHFQYFCVTQRIAIGPVTKDTIQAYPRIG